MEKMALAKLNGPEPWRWCGSFKLRFPPEPSDKKNHLGVGLFCSAKIPFELID
jgi:hypothetical protein